MKELKKFDSNVGYNRVAIKRGESEDVRVSRIRLNAYLKVLEAEHLRIGVARSQHYDGGKRLFDDFERQKLQLQKWGLLSILPAFHMQAWLRVSRAELVVEMSSEALRVLKSKIRHTEYEIAQISNSSKTVTVVGATSMSKEDEKIVLFADSCLPQLNEICQPVAEVVESDANFSSLSGMLAQMDVVCNASLRTFQSLLPEVQSRTFSQRRIVLLRILNKYSQLYLKEGPSLEKDSSEDLTQDPYPSKVVKQSSDHTDAIKSDCSATAPATAFRRADSASDDLCVKWEQYSAWYSERCYALLEIEKEFSSFIEDEREKEGRLLKKWFALSTTKTPSSAFSPFIKKSEHATARSSVANTSGSTSTSSSCSSGSLSNSKSSSSSSSSVREHNKAPLDTSHFDPVRCKSPITPSGGMDMDLSTDMEKEREDRENERESERDSVVCTGPLSSADMVDGQSTDSSGNNNNSSSSSTSSSSNSNNNNSNNNSSSSGGSSSSSSSNNNNSSSNSSTNSSSIGPRADPSLGHASSAKPASPKGRAPGGRAGPAVFCYVPPGPLHSPRSVTAFVEYFCSYYVSNPYGLGSNRVLGDALKALVECLVFNRLNNSLFRYPGPDMKAADTEWRLKCEKCAKVDHRSFGILIRYIDSDCRQAEEDNACRSLNEAVFTSSGAASREVELEEESEGEGGEADGDSSANKRMMVLAGVTSIEEELDVNGEGVAADWEDGCLKDSAVRCVSVDVLDALDLHGHNSCSPSPKDTEDSRLNLESESGSVLNLESGSGSSIRALSAVGTSSSEGGLCLGPLSLSDGYLDPHPHSACHIPSSSDPDTSTDTDPAVLELRPAPCTPHTEGMHRDRDRDTNMGMGICISRSLSSSRSASAFRFFDQEDVTLDMSPESAICDTEFKDSHNADFYAYGSQERADRHGHGQGAMDLPTSLNGSFGIDFDDEPYFEDDLHVDNCCEGGGGTGGGGDRPLSLINLMRKMNSEGDRLAGFESPDSAVTKGLLERDRMMEIERIMQRGRDGDGDREVVSTPERCQSSEQSAYSSKTEQPAKGDAGQKGGEEEESPLHRAALTEPEQGPGPDGPSEAPSSNSESPSVLPFFSSLLSFTASAPIGTTSSSSTSSASSTIDFNNMVESPSITSSGGNSRGELDGDTGGYFSRGAFTERSSNWACDDPEYPLSMGIAKGGQRSCKLNPDILLMDPSDDMGTGPRSECSMREDSCYEKTANEITDSYSNSNMKDGTNANTYNIFSQGDSHGNAVEKEGEREGERALSPNSATHMHSHFKKHAVCNLLEERVFLYRGPIPSPFALTPLASTAEARLEVEVEGKSTGRDLSFKPIAVETSRNKESSGGRDSERDREKERGRGREEGAGDRHYSAHLFREQYKRSVRLLGLVSCCVTPADIVFHVLAAVKWLLKEAGAVSGKSEYLGADLLFPLLVGVLTHSRLPNVHLILHFMSQYGHPDQLGEAAYYMTCLQAAVEFILELQLDEESVHTPSAPHALTHTLSDPESQCDSSEVQSSTVERDRSEDEDADRGSSEGGAMAGEGSRSHQVGASRAPSTPPSPTSFLRSSSSSASVASSSANASSVVQLQTLDQSTAPHRGREKDRDSALDCADKDGDWEGDGNRSLKPPRDDGYAAVVKLGEWLREQEAMEDALSLLQQEGWMR